MLLLRWDAWSWIIFWIRHWIIESDVIHTIGTCLYLYPPTPIIYWFFIFFYQHNQYNLLNMLIIKRGINQQDLKIVNLHFVNSE